MRNMIDRCLAADICPVVLSPFVFATRHSMRSAIAFTEGLRRLAVTRPQMMFIDCIDLLLRYPRRRILLADGFHLSRFGHQCLGEEIARRIIEAESHWSSIRAETMQRPETMNQQQPVSDHGHLGARA
jgi:hypothetical protein